MLAPMGERARSRTVAPMHASSMSEGGAFRIAIAVAIAAALTLGVWAVLGVVAAVAAGVVLAAAGFAFELHHMF